MQKTERKPVFIAAEVSRTLRELLEHDERFEVRYEPARDEASLIAGIGASEVLVTRHYNPLTRRVLEAAPHLRLVAQGTSGLDNIDVNAAAELGIAIADAAGENANAVAELVLANMIALTRTIPAYQRMMQRGAWERADCDTRHELRHFTLGIVGIGRVGRLVAKLASAFGVRCLAYDPYVEAEEVARRGAERVDRLPDLLERSTILTLHVPLTEETRGMIGAGELDRLSRGSYVINASRGEVLDIAALFERIRGGMLAGAALDVFDPEPPSFQIPDDPRIILTPHIAGCSFESKASIGAVIYRKICAFYELEPKA